MPDRDSRAGTRIGDETTVRAKVRGTEDLWIAGRLEGSLELSGVLTVESTGVVKADIRATRVVIAGIVIGEIEATEAIQLLAGCRVQGDLRAPRVGMVEGARFSGTVAIEGLEAEQTERPTVIEARQSPPEAPKPPPIMTPKISIRPLSADAMRRKRIVVKKRS